jgi:hypothetical protein
MTAGGCFEFDSGRSSHQPRELLQRHCGDVDCRVEVAAFGFALAAEEK